MPTSTVGLAASRPRSLIEKPHSILIHRSHFLTDDPVLRIVGMVAAQKLARAFLPLDLGAPPGRLQLMLRDSGSSALITNADGQFDAIISGL